MKKLLLLIIPLFFWGCEKNYDTVLDPETETYQVTGVSSFESRSYQIGDSLLTFYIKVDEPKNINQAYLNIFGPDGKKINSSIIGLYDDGLGVHGDQTAKDGRFSNIYPFSQSLLNGDYTAEYFIKAKDGITKQVALHSFKYDNGTANAAPVISNLVIPDSVAIGSTFIFTVTVEDNNGYNDIETVLFELYRPDGTKAGEFQMVDNGDLEHFGDSTANDAIFSYKNSFSATAQTGAWKFVFFARDRGKKISNKITHNLIVK